MKLFIKKITALLIFTLSILSCLYYGVVSAETSTVDVLERIVENHRGFSEGLSVSYQREIVSRSMALLEDEIKSDIATGVFHFRQPNFLKVHQEHPGEEFIIYNKRYMWWYIPEKKIAYRYSGEQLGKELSILCNIFTGLKNPDQNFNVTITRQVDNNAYLVNLAPKTEWDEIDHIDVMVSGENFKIKKIELYNIVGSVTRFILGEFKARGDIKENFFDFTVPEGIEVILEQ
ncbi:outer membrane lipoprotein carrier protein LolA [Thermodesulfobacteriota bacterium]